MCVRLHVIFDVSIYPPSPRRHAGCVLTYFISGVVTAAVLALFWMKFIFSDSYCVFDETPLSLCILICEYDTSSAVRRPAHAECSELLRPSAQALAFQRIFAGSRNETHV
ncbi:hypothetical protein EVAR_41843_1 [Eumeta japonica]|uniref:Uncharacterized protein n=1 Tax=Eumeta variegata TaxID=151549 RepID=A0A4C1XAF8_EUMVA|nr:hypothetical protein EVAR_41843_1 [Eumeta japonica]